MSGTVSSRDDRSDQRGRAALVGDLAPPRAGSGVHEREVTLAVARKLMKEQLR